MKIQEILDTFYEASGTSSESSRKLAFAGIAVIWVLKVGKDSGGIAYSPELIAPLFFFVTSLGCDLLQYVYKAGAYGLLNKRHWNMHGNNDTDVEVPSWVNTPTNMFFLGKIVSVIVGYGYLLFFLAKNMS